MMNENTREKTERAIKAICTDLERVAKKALIFNASIQAMQLSDSFKKFDYEEQFTDIEVMMRLTAERITEVVKGYKED